MRQLAPASLVVVAVLASQVSAARAEAQETPPAPPPAEPAAAPPAAPPAEPALPSAEEPPAPVAEPPAPAPSPEEGPKPEAAPESKPDEAPAPMPPPAAPDSLCPKGALCMANEKVAVWPKAVVRAGYEYVQADPDVLFVGHNDGFFLEQARIGLEGTYGGKLGFRLVFDAASVLPGADPNDPVRALVAATKDAYVAWEPITWFRLSVGQQYMPVDVEGSILGDAELVFARRSVATSGVRAGHGFQVDGLTPGRQIGVVLGSGKDAAVGPVSLEYRLGISNGNGANVLGNDNKLPALFLRVGAGYGDYVKLGGGVGYDPRTVGTLPNDFVETDLLAFGDARVAAFGIHALAQIMWRQTTFDTVVPDPTSDLRSETGLGVTSWLYLDDPFGLPFFGVKPGYRISYYDPSSQFADDQLLENAIAVRYDAPYLPFATILDFTLPTEMGTGVRDLDNWRVTLAAQVDL